MTTLADREFKPQHQGPPLKGEALQRLFQELDNDWELVEDHHLEKEFRFKNFQEALDFVNKVGQLAEELNHHPDICLGWGYAEVAIFTHSAEGLTEADFVFAARVDRLLG